jgi:hypothetical protein
MTDRLNPMKKKNTPLNWLWLLVKVVVTAGAYGAYLGWLKENVDPAARWFVYLVSYLIFFALMTTLVFGVRLKIPGLTRSERAPSDHDA